MAPKVTLEEKKARRKQKKEAKKLRKIQIKRERHHDQLEREIKYGNLTYEKHEKQWRQMLLQIALPRVKEDLQYAWHNFERLMDAKDFHISLLLDELDVAEEQCLRNVRNHIDGIDSLIDFMRRELTDIKKDYEQRLKALRRDNRLVRERLAKTASEGEELLKMIIFGLEQIRKAYEKNIRGDFISKLEDEGNKEKEVVYIMTIAKENQFEKIWNYTKDFIHKYLESTKERRQQHDQLYSQDQLTRQHNAEQFKKMVKMKAIIKRLRQKFTNLQENKLAKIAKLHAEKQYFADVYNAFKNVMQSIMAKSNSNVTRATVTGYDMLKSLKALETKGEHVLHLIVICSKLQTEEELIVPFSPPKPCILRADEEIIKEESVYLNLDMLWGKLAKADAMRYTLGKEKKFLQHDNMLLKKQINYFCQCFDCPAYPPADTRRKNDKINVCIAQDEFKKYAAFNTKK